MTGRGFSCDAAMVALGGFWWPRCMMRPAVGVAHGPERMDACSDRIVAVCTSLCILSAGRSRGGPMLGGWQSAVGGDGMMLRYSSCSRLSMSCKCTGRRGSNSSPACPVLYSYTVLHPRVLPVTVMVGLGGHYPALSVHPKRDFLAKRRLQCLFDSNMSLPNPLSPHRHRHRHRSPAHHRSPPSSS